MELAMKMSGPNNQVSYNDENGGKTINQGDGSKVPLCREKHSGVCYRKVIPMKSVIKTSGHTHPGRDNYLKQQQKTINHGDSDRAPLNWEN